LGSGWLRRWGATAARDSGHDSSGTGELSAGIGEWGGTHSFTGS
jgi:hypothetical protein